MKYILLLMLFSFIENISAHSKPLQTPTALRKKVGLLIVATGKYNRFIPPLIESARTYFCTDCDVTYFVFADGIIPQAPDIVHIYQKRLGWPYDTLMRCKFYYDARDICADQDYLFACDADMLFVNTVGQEILSERTGTVHPGFTHQRGTYENTNPDSSAYVKESEGTHYYAGGFYGAKQEEFIRINKTMKEGIEKDLARNFIAVWHDESHLNRYFIDHPPVLVLSPSYCYPENWHLHYPKCLLALDKNHHEMRK